MSASEPGPGSTAPRQRPSPLGVPLQLTGAGLILIGAFVPWVRSHALFLDVPVRGVDTDYGRVFPFLALTVYGLLAVQWSFGWRKWAAGLILLLGAAVLVVAILYGIQVKQRVARIDASAKDQPQAPFVFPGGTLFRVDFDVGYYLTLLGAGSAIVGAAADLRAGRKKSP